MDAEAHEGSGEQSPDEEEEKTSISEEERENCFKSVSDNKDIAKLASLISTCINSNKRVSYTGQG